MDNDFVTIQEAFNLFVDDVAPHERQLREIAERLERNPVAVYSLTPADLDVVVAGLRLARAVAAACRCDALNKISEVQGA